MRLDRCGGLASLPDVGWVRLRAGVVATVLCAAACVFATIASPRASGGGAPILRYKYVLNGNEVAVYNLGDPARETGAEVSRCRCAMRRRVAADAATGTLYVSFGGEGGSHGSSALLAYDLLSSKVLWVHQFTTGVDSIALAPAPSLCLPTARSYP
jgi:hypothetical protein